MGNKVVIECAVHNLWQQGGLDKFSMKYIWKNYSFFKKSGKEFDDLFHETYIIFHACCEKFKGENKKQFVAYYKTALHNNMMQFRVDSIEDDNNLVEGCVSDMPYLVDHVNSNLGIFFRYLSDEAKVVIAFLFNSPRELLEDIGFMNHKSKGVFNNKKLCDLLGYDSRQIDLVKETQISLGQEFE